MKKKVLIGIAVPLVASIGLWLGLGGSAVAHTPKKAARVSSQARPAGRSATHAVKAVHAPKKAGSKKPHVSRNTSTGASETEGDTESENESGADTEGDGVDCQQEGNFEGVNAAGTGPGCTGAGQ